MDLEITFLFGLLCVVAAIPSIRAGPASLQPRRDINGISIGLPLRELKLRLGPPEKAEHLGAIRRLTYSHPCALSIDVEAHGAVCIVRGHKGALAHIEALAFPVGESLAVAEKRIAGVERPRTGSDDDEWQCLSYPRLGFALDYDVARKIVDQVTIW
jgi:hypothetical protein